MIRIGVIGAGGNGRGHARYYSRSPRTTLVAVADPDAGRAEAAAAECGAEAVADFHEFLDDVDAVVVSSPNHMHRDHAVECARAGRHVYCEKPMGIDTGQAREIADAVAEAGVKAVVGFSVRFTPQIQTILRRVREGQLGRIVSIWSRRMSYSPPASGGHWRDDPRLSGGVLFEINIHELDWMMAVGGRVVSVYGRKYARDPSYERANDHVWAVLNFADGPVATLEGSSASQWCKYERGVAGERAALCTAEWGKRLLMGRDGKPEQEVPLDPRFDLRGHFLDCIEKDAPCVSDAQHGLEVTRVAEAVIDSAISGEAQRLV